MIKRSFCFVLLVTLASCLLKIRLPVGESRCYGELGCLELNSEWFNVIKRPVNLYPLNREDIDTKFVLYTRKNSLDGQKLVVADDNYIKNSNFNSSKETKFLIHGFLDSTIFSDWLKVMRLALLERGDMNVFEVDWDKGSVPPYTQATANTRLVGLELGHFINHLKEFHGLDPKNVHLIGHSLGAHISGYAGEKIPGLERITGLDPAGPYFQGMGIHVRLDPTDATFVDVIHTNGASFGLGMSSPCGHLDFYPNGGKRQPACKAKDTLTPLKLLSNKNAEDVVREAVSCSHLRAIDFFIESINSQCPFIGLRCTNYRKYLKRQCPSTGNKGSACAVMGYDAKKVDVQPLTKYYLLTKKEAPYCRKPGRAEKKCLPQTSSALNKTGAPDATSPPKSTAKNPTKSPSATNPPKSTAKNPTKSPSATNPPK